MSGIQTKTWPYGTTKVGSVLATICNGPLIMAIIFHGDGDAPGEAFMLLQRPGARRPAAGERSAITFRQGGPTGGYWDYAPIDFTCRVCGKQCAIAPNPPERAVCEKHCEDHEYEYERGEQCWLCKHCGQPRAFDWFYDD